MHPYAHTYYRLVLGNTPVRRRMGVDLQTVDWTTGLDSNLFKGALSFLLATILIHTPNMCLDLQ